MNIYSTVGSIVGPLVAKFTASIDSKLIVLSAKPDGAGTPRYGWLNDTFEGEAFDERRSGIGSILSEPAQERFLKSCQLPWCDVADLTEEQEAWVEATRENYLESMNSVQATLSAEEFSAKLVADLVWLNKTFGRIFAFEDMVNEFLAHAGELEYQAMWATMMEFALSSQPDEPIEFEPWSDVDAETRYFSPRWVIKDFLAVFANKPLRKYVFGV